MNTRTTLILLCFCGASPLAAAETPSPVLDNIWNYQRDVGKPFALRSSGLHFGWSTDMANHALDIGHRNAPDERYDRGIAFKPGSRWELRVANGWYRVSLTVGASDTKRAHCQANVEGVAAIDRGDPRANWPWVSNTVSVNVQDGKLTIESGPKTENCFLAHVQIYSTLTGRFDKPTKVDLPLRVNTGGYNWHGYIADKPWVENADHGFVVPKIIQTRVKHLEEVDFINADEDTLFQSVRSTADAKTPLVYRIRTDSNVSRLLTIGLANYGVDKAKRLELGVKVNGRQFLPKTEFHQDPGPNKVKVVKGRVDSDADGIVEITVESLGTLYPHPPHLAFLTLEDPEKDNSAASVESGLPEPGSVVKVNFGTESKLVDLRANPYLEASKRFCDAMLLYGVNKQGEVYRAVDLTKRVGIKVGDPNVDQDVYRLLYLLSEATGDQKYRTAADRGIRHFLRHRSGTGIITWAEGGGSVNCENDQFPVIHDDLWRLDPLRMLIASHDYWENGIGDKSTGDFDRHCSSTAVGVPFARHGGAMINLWMEAYKRTNDRRHLDRAKLLTNFYRNLMKSNEYEYWTKPVEMVMLLGMGVNMNVHALLPDQPERDFMLDFCRRNSKTQVTNDVWSRRNLHAHAIMANRFYQLQDTGEEKLAQAYRKRLLELIRKEYSGLEESEIQSQSKDVGAVILTCLAAYKISGDPQMLRIAKVWADHGLKTFLKKTDLPPLVAGGTTYGRISGGSNGGNTPSTLPLGLFLLGMELDNPQRRVLLINAPF